MKNRPLTTLAAVASLTLVLASPARAANKEHQQQMADIRMLQEQAQLLQNMLGTLAETLKAVNARLDQQADASRKAAADERLLIDNLIKDLGVVREKVDDNNVRVGSIAQEVDALRQLVQQALARPTTTTTTDVDPSRTPEPVQAGATAPPAFAPPTTIGASPTKAYDQAYGDYTAALWDLAIDGFTAFLRDFPKHDKADDAQFLIGRSFFQDAKYDKAVEAFDRLARTYPTSNSLPDSYYLKGLAYRNLKQVDRAREAWETVLKSYPDSPAASLSKQALGRP